MHKALKYTAITLALICIALVGLYIHAANTLDLSFDNATAAHTKARKAFLADLPDIACLRPPDIAAMAQARGWDTWPEPDFNWCVTPDTVAGWLRVTIEPGLPFSTDDENAQIFAFDENGCAVDWSYASGAGSTCPNT